MKIFVKKQLMILIFVTYQTKASLVKNFDDTKHKKTT